MQLADRSFSMAMTRIPDTARCLKCGYRLRGLPAPRCPECGQPFDPADPNSYYDPARPKRSALRRFIRLAMPHEPHSPGDLLWVMLLTVAVVWSSGSVRRVFALHPGIMDPPCCVAIGVPFIKLLLALTVFDLLWRWRVFVKARRTRNQPIVDNFRNGRTRWRLAIACLVICCITVVSPWPVYGRFYLSWRSLEHEARACLAGHGDWLGWRRIGLYHVEYLHGRYKGCVFFQVAHDGDGYRYGFSYRPNGPAPWNDRWGRHRIHWRPLLPGWYLEAW
jgi:hypothetical protein